MGHLSPSDISALLGRQRGEGGRHTVHGCSAFPVWALTGMEGLGCCQGLTKRQCLFPEPLEKEGLHPITQREP